MTTITTGSSTIPPPPLPTDEDARGGDSPSPTVQTAADPSQLALEPVTPSRISTFDFGDGEDSAKALPPVDGGRHAWQFLAASFLLEIFVWGYAFSFATILVYLQSHDPWQQNSLSALSAIGTTQLGLLYVLPTFAVVVLRRYGEYVRLVQWTSLVVSCCSMFLSSWATQLWQLVVLQGFLCGVANTLIFAPVFLYFSDWWVARRGMAWGVIGAGNGFGGFILPWLINAVLEAKGSAWMCRVWTAFTAVTFAASIILLQPRIPFVKPTDGRAPWLAVDWRFSHNPVFLCMAISTLFASLAYLPVANYLAVYAASFSSSTMTINLVVGLFNLAACGGCILVGRIADYSLTLGLTLVGLCGLMLSLTAWGLADTLGKVYAFAVLFGLTGQQAAASAAVTKDLSLNSPQTSTLIVTLLAAVRGATSLFIPVVLQALYDSRHAKEAPTFGKYGFLRMIVFVGAASAGLALCGLLMGGLRRKYAIKSN
ncbi:hypothetical protein NBRC10512_006471 [Rhodotorula toruloides]|uniref:RHTO0S01e02960g1_1 n=2 Tax=Rhodotorula toruloides TaxID=5286 RepID=A0A061ADJ9_RHOTO|nr:MFS monocarboxylate transporter [Rhodotorula toruloides NP11]EMS19741.1 MFS monocarboxylate transporter [Rhodotorula toruloides NP11]CDR35599.1 RHTO0S01e02960g1_1 [Rhodotorula toruloides]